MSIQIKQLVRILLGLIILMIILAVIGRSIETFVTSLNYDVLIIGFGLGGLIYIYFFIKSILEVRASNHWPSVEGEIVSSSLGIQQGEDQLYYQPVIIYSYNVGGRDYQAKRVVIGQIPINTGKDWAEKKVNSYPPGKRVNVYYSPNSPQKAVLEPGWNSQLLLRWFGIAIVGGFLVFFISFLITWLLE